MACALADGKWGWLSSQLGGHDQRTRCCKKIWILIVLEAKMAKFEVHTNN